MERLAGSVLEPDVALVSLCMIVKNEEQDLPHAIRSAVELADEIVVYDTGSTDDTVAIARSLGATVLEGYWDDNFSRARNAALAECHGRWVLWLDADESLEGDLGGLRDRLVRDEDGVDAFVVPIESLEGSGLGGRLAFHAMRVFRRNSCHWAGALHEQIVDRSTGAIARGGWASEVRILHRGYVASTQFDRDKVARNLRIAEAALDDPSVDRSTALFNYARTLASTDEPERALGPIREAADTTAHPTVRRQALQTEVRLLLDLGHYDQAFATIEELRTHSTRQITADLLEARARLYREEFEQVLDITDRVPFVDLDDDGFEGGRHLVAWMRARAFAGLGRPSDAADALLDALRTHGILDEPLGALTRLLAESDRSFDEIGASVRPECVAVVAAAAAKLPLPEADLVLDGLYRRFHDRVEVLAAAALFADRLPIVRALAWSSRLRERGLIENCPVVAIANRVELEPIVRLRAAAAAYGAFADERALTPAREALESFDAPMRPAALVEIAEISPALASLLEASRTTTALHVHRDGGLLAGHREFWPERLPQGSDPRLVLPFEDESLHAAVVDELLAMLDQDRAEDLLDELFRVTLPEATVKLTVPNLEHAARRLLSEGDLDEAAAMIFGNPADRLPYRSGWTSTHLERTLAARGFVPAPIQDGPLLEVTARRPRLEVHRGAHGPHAISVVVAAGDDAGKLRSFLEALASTDLGVGFELVLVGDQPCATIRDLAVRLEGDVTIALSPVPLPWARAITLGASLARSELALVIDPSLRLGERALATLVSEASSARSTDSSLAGFALQIRDSSGQVSSTGIELHQQQNEIVLSLRQHHVRLDAPMLRNIADVDAADWRCFAVRTDAFDHVGGLRSGLEAADAVVDWALRARSAGSIIRYLPDAIAVDTEDRTEISIEPKSRQQLARRWRMSGLIGAAAQTWTRASLLPTGTMIDRVRAGSWGRVIGTPTTGGVNLVGNFGETGYGKIRTERYRAILERLHIPFSVIDYRDGRVAATSGGEPFCFDTTILCFDADEMMPYLATVGVESMANRFTIGTWHYPFVAPNSDTAPFALMTNELWLPSETATRAIAKASTKAALTAPPEIAVSHEARLITRAQLGLPSGPLIVTIADVGSGTAGEIARANPTGVVEAFLRAFPQTTEYQLVVRIVGAKVDAAAEAVQRAANGDRRITVDTSPLSIENETATILNADCYCSLTRASAFDYPLAIALAAATPVVGVAHGGPEELLRFECAEKVSFSLAETDRRHLPYPIGTPWAEPDINDAAERLRGVFEDPERSARKAHRGAVMMRERHSSAVADQFVSDRLQAIFKLDKALENEPSSERAAPIPQLSLTPSR